MNLRAAAQRLVLNEDLNFLLTNRVPRIALTRFMGWWSRIRHPWVRDASMAVWKTFSDLDLSEAQKTHFDSLHDCFTRELKPGLRPLDGRPGVLTSPSDGIVGACGRIEPLQDGADAQLFQAKGFPYRLLDLLGDDARGRELAQQLQGGSYVTLRLTSSMYHRFHAPCDATLEHVTYISGDTWNVNPVALKRVERLFCRNERAVLRLRRADGGLLVLVPVAAILVASMRLRALDVPLNLRYRGPHQLPCSARYQQGEELGWFEHGSTILVLAPPGLAPDPTLQSGHRIRMGEALLQTTPSPLQSMTTVDLIYFNAGGGHRASALALQAVLREQGRPWDVRLVNLFEVLDPTGRFQRITGKAPEDWYNQRLARGWTLGMAQELKLLQSLIRVGHPALLRRLRRHWQTTRPDLVVSLIPNFNRALCESLDAARPGVPYVTVLTDLADFPPHFWIERHPLQHVVCGTPRAVEQALSQGHDAHHVHATSGMILRPEFYRPGTLNRADEQRRLGLDPGRPTGLVLFGGHGSKAMVGIAERLIDTQLILVCGHNQKLADALRALPQVAPRLVVGFSTDIPRYMQLADFLIGKPGPGSVSEAVQQQLPVIVVNNAWTMPQERYNALWIEENRVGLVLRSFRSIDRGVAQLLGDLDAYRASVRQINNRALFEIPEILAGLLQGEAPERLAVSTSNPFFRGTAPLAT